MSACPSGATLPLSLAKAGETLQVVRIKGADSMKRHLENLGFVEGSSITVISDVSGDVIVEVKGSRLALNKSMSHRIFVSLV